MPGGIPKIRGTQIGLRDPALVDQIKEAMRAELYAYRESRGRIAGVRDRHGTYHVADGHHRMVAAVELYRETGNPTAILELVGCGDWDDKPRPHTSCPLPARSWWGALRNLLWF